MGNGTKCATATFTRKINIKVEAKVAKNFLKVTKI